MRLHEHVAVRCRVFQTCPPRVPSGCTVRRTNESISLFMIKVGRGSCPCSVTAPHGCHPRSRARRRWRPHGSPQHSALSCTGNQFIEVREMPVMKSFAFHFHRARTTFPRPTARGSAGAQSTPCHRPSSPRPASSPRPPRPSLPVPSRSARTSSRPTFAPTLTLLALSARPIGKSGAWCSRAPSPRHTGTPVEPELAVACVLAGGPIRGGGAPSVMTRAANSQGPSHVGRRMFSPMR